MPRELTRGTRDGSEDWDGRAVSRGPGKQSGLSFLMVTRAPHTRTRDQENEDRSMCMFPSWEAVEGVSPQRVNQRRKIR